VFKSLGTTELLILALILLVLFGSKKLPELGKGLGEAIKELKKVSSDKDDK
jgi:sec-independent protein translocase protein TatA